jgi:hypothetical protein
MLNITNGAAPPNAMKQPAMPGSHQQSGNATNALRMMLGVQS